MNEPSVFNAEKTMPLNVVHRVDSGSGERLATHREIHNVYGMANVHATYEGMLALRPDVRPVVMTRAGYAGTQRYAATWTGDTSSTWTHLGMSVPMLLNLGLSGYPLAGDDIGGFAGSSTPDLLTRWIELGAFNTIYRNHSSIGTANQEPWVGPPPARGDPQEIHRDSLSPSAIHLHQHGRDFSYRHSADAPDVPGVSIGRQPGHHRFRIYVRP
jgi:alpha-glucosidase